MWEQGMLLVAVVGVGVGALVVVLLIWKVGHCCSCWLHTSRRGKEAHNEASQPLLLQDPPPVHSLPKSHRQDGKRTFKVPQVSEAGAPFSDGRQPTAIVGKKAQRSTITLEVISGPSTGTRITSTSGQPLTLGRVPQNNLVLNDPEVSGKHAYIKWNSQRSIWEVVDMGSLNGTLVNHQPICFDQLYDPASRKAGVPFGLATGDIVSLGSTSQVLVHISNDMNASLLTIKSGPFEVGLAADPMTLRRGGNWLTMEDVCLCEWPLRGLQQFGAFCIFDGHGGAAAAQAASKIMPQKLSDILRAEAKQAEVLSSLDATDVLKSAFSATEEALDHEYEGCTATVLLLWLDPNSIVYAQCANVGDSACIFSLGGKYISMTEDHRLTSFSERSRMLEMGKQLGEGESRLCGMNIARVLGDKFLKEQDARFSSQPFISDVLRITKDSKALAIMASDGLWDVISQTRALQLALEAKEGRHLIEGTERKPLSAKGIAELLVSKARLLRTRDNTSVIVLDF